MSEFMSKWFASEAFKHPAFFLMSVISIGIGGGMLMNPFVMAGDFSKFEDRTNTRLGSLEAAVCIVQYTLEKNGLDAQLRSVEKEIYQLEGVVQDGDGNSRDVARLSDLRPDKGKLDRELQDLLRDEACEQEGRS